MKSIRTGISVLLLGCVVPAIANEIINRDSKEIRIAAATPAASLADGEIRRVDKDGAKLTIRHGPMPSLDMPPMTMVFRVKDTAMLDQVKVGDKIRFEAANEGGAYTVIRMETVK